jgi:ubiquitin conjugation factor E4 B
MADAEDLLMKEDADMLLEVLRVGLEPAAPATGSGSRSEASDVYVPLPELGAELAAEAGGEGTDRLARWSELGARRSLFDRALVARLSCADAPAFDFLVASFRRCAEAKSRARSPSAEVEELFGYLSGLCVSYASIALLNPSMFPQPPAVEREGVCRIISFLRRDGLDGGLPPGFLSRMVSRMAEDETLDEFGPPLFQALYASLKPKSILDGFETDYRALHAMVREKPLGSILARLPSFVPPARTGHALETHATLGPFLGLSCFPSDRRVPDACFPAFSAPDVEGGTTSLRLSLQARERMPRVAARPLHKSTELTRAT